MLVYAFSVSLLQGIIVLVVGCFQLKDKIDYCRVYSNYWSSQNMKRKS